VKLEMRIQRTCFCSLLEVWLPFTVHIQCLRVRWISSLVVHILHILVHIPNTDTQINEPVL
jgi:hypothetical protein